jgi:hypothetical protein
LSFYSAELKLRSDLLISDYNEILRNRGESRRRSVDPVISWRNVRQCETAGIVSVGFRHKRTTDME